MKVLVVLSVICALDTAARGEISIRESLAAIRTKDENEDALAEEKKADECRGKCISVKTKPPDCRQVANKTGCGQNFVCCMSANSSKDSQLLSTVREDLPHIPELTLPSSLEHPSREAGVLAENSLLNVSGLRSARSQRFHRMGTQMLARSLVPVCQGQCMNSDLLGFCSNPLSNSACGEGKFCCATSPPSSGVSSLVSISDIRLPSLRPLPCPETCMSFFLSFFCDRIAREYYCPDGGRCCISGRLSLSQSAVPCLGSCIPGYLSGLCTKPLQLNVHASNCPSNRVCCQKVPSVSLAQGYRPQFERVPQFPANMGIYQPGQAYPNRVAGNLGPVRHFIPNNPNSQLAPNQHFVHGASSQVHPNRQFVIPVDANGHVVPGDPRVPGKLFVVLDGSNVPTVPRQTVLVPEDQNDKFDSPHYLVMPNGQIVLSGHPTPVSDNTNTDASPSFQNASVSRTANQMVQGASGNPTQIISPGEDDKKEDQRENNEKDDSVSQTDDSSMDISGQEVNPQCPGTCISSFLRFTCFGRHALYPGFQCSAAGGRTICCASLKDIQKREEELNKERTTKVPRNTQPQPTQTPLQSNTDDTCGIKSRRRKTPRVVGGFDSIPGEWCWQVAVINSKSQYVCGGTLIDRRWVLTAAHCVVNTKRNDSAIFIRAGETDLSSTVRNTGAQTRRVSTTYVHHNHNSETLDNDIALLKLQDPVKLSSSVCLVCLPAMGVHPKAGRRCTVTGYGFIGEDGPIALRVREASVPIVSDEECAKRINATATPGFVMPLNSFCAGGEGNSDSCQGDGGGPLVCEADKYYELTGIVSWGLGCGRQHLPGLYVRVSSFTGWMNQIISVNSDH